ncbi:MAG: hypothetical protein NW224_09355 [Leptolyngbyaceae cyanobacterium bins.302]|nr:hypothetical protein [Leptolyngbyaceae cyanobacterium bins.302]
MKRLLLSLILSVLVSLNLAVDAVHAQPQLPFGLSSLFADASAPFNEEVMTQLETKVLPELEAIFTPEQREQFKTNIANGATFRKAFKSLSLTPAQKLQLKNLFGSLTKKDALATLTPEQKQQLFMKKKEVFMPTPEEIADKISAGMKGKGLTLPEGVKEKIDASMKSKESFKPTPEAILEKIKSSMSAEKAE